MWYNVLAMKQYQRQYSPKQGRLPVYIADILDICDPVLTFDQIMEEIGIEQYLKPDTNPWHLGRPRFNQVNMLKTVLFSFMDIGYCFCCKWYNKDERTCEAVVRVGGSRMGKTPTIMNDEEICCRQIVCSAGPRTASSAGIMAQ